MPYNTDKDLGGDSKENTAWMERCVNNIVKGGKDKSSAVAICKAQLRKKKQKDSSLESIDIDIDISNAFTLYRERYIRGVMASLQIDYTTANGMFMYHLAKKNYDIYRE